MALKPFRVTKQTALVIEESYELNASDADDAQDKFSEEFSDGDQLDPVHTETVQRHWEITNVEEVACADRGPA